MAKRLRRGYREREALLRRAVESSELERRRIASDLHDGVVQQLAGTSFSLEAAAERQGKNGDGGEPPAEALRRGAAQTRQSVRELRSLLVEIYPASLRDAGLEQALSDLLAPAGGRGIETSLEIDEGLELSSETEALLYRVAQEAVRNAVRHATPSGSMCASGARAMRWHSRSPTTEPGSSPAAHGGRRRGSLRPAPAHRSRA